MVIRPASADYGIWFRRSDVMFRRCDDPGALGCRGASRALCTLSAKTLRASSVSTIEHLMAALARRVASTTP
jgi:UDP-3-O-[3-hydroxymyristoyl] N-acetylglucosamine deacetylase